MAQTDGGGKRRGMTYRDAGVDIDAQDDALARIKGFLRATRTPGVLSELGSFGGLFAPDWRSLDDPILVSSADGVGTKLRVAFRTGIHHTCGRDLVNHCVNDILVQGARPLFFLDYVACGRLDPGVLADVVRGVADGCRENGCALLGGETAEMPGFYADGEYDVAGFVVGMVDRSRLLDGAKIRPGDVLLGLASAGLHTNGYSLARKLFFDVAGLAPEDRVDALGCSVAEALLAEHRSYLRPLEGVLEDRRVRGLAHITGGGLTDNVPRILPAGCAAEIRRGAWEIPALFRWLQETGGIDDDEMYRAFNMGVGMVVVVSSEEADTAIARLAESGERAFPIGRVVDGERRVRYVRG